MSEELSFPGIGIAGGPGEDLTATTVALLQEMVRNACVNDGSRRSGHEHRNAATLEAFFAHTPVDIRRVEPAPGRTTLVVTVEGTDPQAEPLTLIGHTDVVPVDEEKWSTDPFGAQVSDGVIHGRGTVDMLHLTAAMAVVTRQVALQVAGAAQPGGTPRPRGTLTFIAAADEEARAGLGIGWLEKHGHHDIPLRNCLSEMGGAHVHGQDGSDTVVVAVGEKGAAQRRLHISGDPGHGSTPLGRTSAVDRIAEVALRLTKAEFPVVTDELWAGFVRAFRFAPDTEESLLHGTYDGDFHEFGGLAAWAHAISRMTVSRTVINAGGAINVLPSAAHLDLDIRTLPGQDDDEVDAHLRAALGDLADEVRIERLICEQATASPTDTRLYRVIEEVLAAQHPGSEVAPVLFPGGTDLRFARRAGGVGYGVGSFAKERSLGQVYAQLHAHDEHLHLEDLDLCVSALWQIVTRFLA